MPGLIQYVMLQNNKGDEYQVQIYLLNFVEIPVMHLIAINGLNHQSA